MKILILRYNAYCISFPCFIVMCHECLIDQFQSYANYTVAYCLTYHFAFCDLHPTSHGPTIVITKLIFSPKGYSHDYIHFSSVLILNGSSYFQGLTSHPAPTIKSLQLGNTVTDHPVLCSPGQVKKSDSHEEAPVKLIPLFSHDRQQQKSQTAEESTV
jgi:hypothetical protein